MSAVDTVPIASYWRRVAAWAIDTVILFIALFVIVAVLIALLVAGASSPDEENGVGLLLGFLLLPFIPLYSALFHRFWHGQTIGKRALGIAVRRLDGDEIALGQSLGRSYLRLVLWAGYVPVLLDSLWPLWQERRRALHDLAAGTIVVSLRSSPPMRAS
jgi:uncharacterized RDD family membrane protein YckC